MDEGETLPELTMNETKHFAICIRNEGYEGALELRKLYEIIDDANAARHDSIRSRGRVRGGLPLSE